MVPAFYWKLLAAEGVKPELDGCVRCGDDVPLVAFDMEQGGALCRVCRTGGRIIILNHFRSENRLVARFERAISPLTIHIGFTADLDLPAFLTQAGLRPTSIEKINVPRIWSLVIVGQTCRSTWSIMRSVPV